MEIYELPYITDRSKDVMQTISYCKKTVDGDDEGGKDPAPIDQTYSDPDIGLDLKEEEPGEDKLVADVTEKDIEDKDMASEDDIPVVEEEM